MPVQFEALIGHLSIVGGKPSDDQPPGARIQVPPRRVHRSREQDTIFVLITPAGQTRAKPEFYSDLAALACNVFFKSRLGVTGALREVAAALNDDIVQRNQQQATDYRAGALVLIKRVEEVYLMRAGSAICVAQRNHSYETFPSDPDMLNLMPLGARSEPQLEFSRFPLAPDDLFLIGDGGVAAISDAVLRAAVATQNIEMVLETLERSVQRQAFATVVKFIDANAPQPALAASIPLAMPLEAPIVDEAAPIEEAAIAEAPTEISSEPFAAATIAASISTPPDDPLAQPAAEAVPSTPPDDPLTQSAASIDAEETTIRPVKAKKPKPPRQNIFQLLLAGVLITLAGTLRLFANGINGVLDRLLPEPTHKSKNQQFVPMNIVALVAILVPAVVAVVVVGVAISNRDETTFEGLRDVAVQARNDALQVEQNLTATRSDKRLAWNEARNWAQQALNENPDSSEMLDLFKEAQNKINSYDNVTAVAITELREFESNADLRGPIVGGQDIYTLDRNRSQVYRDRLDGSGRAIVEKGETPILERGRRVNNFIVSNITDIEWITTPGVGQTFSLIALDDTGLLLSYHPTFGESAIELDTPADWTRPIAIALWDVNLYVLDAGANQIWRYRPENGFFQNPPEEYFTGNNRPELRSAVDFGIDDRGDIYILFSDGTISGYRGGEPLAFELRDDTVPVQGITNGTALYVNNNGGDYALYVADRNNQTVYKISLGGTVHGGYRPLDLLSNILNQVSGVYDDPARGNVYMLSGNRLYQAPRIVE